MEGLSFSESKFLVQYFITLFVLQEQFTALHHASANGHLPVVKGLLDRGANVRAQNLVSVSSWSCAACSVNCSLYCVVVFYLYTKITVQNLNK